VPGHWHRRLQQKVSGLVETSRADALQASTIELPPGTDSAAVGGWAMHGMAAGVSLGGAWGGHLRVYGGWGG